MASWLDLGPAGPGAGNPAADEKRNKPERCPKLEDNKTLAKRATKGVLGRARVAHSLGLKDGIKPESVEL